MLRWSPHATLWACAASAGVILLAALMRLRSGGPQLGIEGFLIEGILFASLCVLAANSAPLRRNLRSIGAARQLALLAFFALLFGAQLSKPGRNGFPFLTWSMFTKPVHERTVTYFGYAGVTAAGQEIPLHPSLLVPPLGHGRLVNRLAQLIQSRLNPGAGADPEGLDQTLLALARIHNRRHPGESIVRVRVYRNITNSVGSPVATPEMIFESSRR